MDAAARKRGFSSLPLTGHEYYTTKKEMTERRSYPPCPPLPPKGLKKRSSRKSLFPEERTFARAIFSRKPVSLCKLYDKEKQQTYFDQIFTSIHLIGEGSFGFVFKAKSREDNKFYAVKQLKTSKRLQYGFAEVENLEKVGDHLNCVQFYKAWEEGNIVHIQMELCQLSLAQYALAVGSKLPESQLWEILYDILSALDHLHTKRLIHLDVKPGNIMMSKGFYKLTDFGLLVDLNMRDGNQVSTISEGDAKYLASEVLNGNYTCSCDMFSLGITLVELATNIVLPEYGNLWQRIRDGFLPEHFQEVVTPDLGDIIKQMMSKEHTRRPTASRLLKRAPLKVIKQRDSNGSRIDYCRSVLDEPHLLLNNNNNNNNIVETPRRPLYEVRNSLSHESNYMDNSSNEVKHRLHDSSSPCTGGNSTIISSTTRRGLSRVRLAFN